MNCTLERRLHVKDDWIPPNGDSSFQRYQGKEGWALGNDPQKGSPRVLSTRSWSGDVGFLLPSYRPWVGRRSWGFWVWGVVVLNCVSPPGAELEESNKNTKKLDAMTLIKEGGSQHPLWLGSRAHKSTFPVCTPQKERAA